MKLRYRVKCGTWGEHWEEEVPLLSEHPDIKGAFRLVCAVHGRPYDDRWIEEVVKDETLTSSDDSADNRASSGELQGNRLKRRE